MDTNKYDVIISKRAQHMLGSHINFLAKVDKKAAKQKEKEIVKAIRSLAEFPYRFPFIESDFIPPNKYRKMFIAQWYLVLYQIKDNAVYVDYILDCRRSYTSLI